MGKAEIVTTLTSVLSPTMAIVVLLRTMDVEGGGLGSPRSGSGAHCPSHDEVSEPTNMLNRPRFTPSPLPWVSASTCLPTPFAASTTIQIRGLDGIALQEEEETA